ncbi:MAG TPA: hypothetical protein PKC21_00905 [Oligoflexia bacterium]|nr:hypothetical protein [Oligoflexia bacterium]HMR23888.1 hypothetical protein [Oligoflexia bacterium]
MNKTYGVLLALVFLFGIGAFNIGRGIQSIRRKRKSTLWGILRVIFGIPIVLLPFVLLFYLTTSGQI